MCVGFARLGCQGRQCNRIKRRKEKAALKGRGVVFCSRHAYCEQALCISVLLNKIRVDHRKTSSTKNQIFPLLIEKGLKQAIVEKRPMPATEVVREGGTMKITTHTDDSHKAIFYKRL
jgi:hypothetical protein